MDVYSALKQFLTIKEMSYTEGDNYISFRYNEWNFVLLCDKDPYYFRLALPRLVAISNDSFILLKKALSLSAHYKVAKAVIIQDEIWLLFEELLGDYDFKNSNLFERAIAILSSFARDFKSSEEDDEKIDNKQDEK